MDRREAQREYDRIKTDLIEVVGMEEVEHFFPNSTLHPESFDFTFEATERIIECFATLRAVINHAGEAHPADRDVFDWAEAWQVKADGLVERARTVLRGGVRL